MTISAEDVKEIMRLLEASRFDELKLEADGVRLVLRRGAGAVEETAVPVTSSPQAAAAPVAAPTQPVAANSDLTNIPAPLLGIYYRAPKPGEPPFVEVGTVVEEDTIIGIIEVMKLMNPIHASVRGEIVEILAQNAAAVEYGQTLMRVRKAR
jgi:acetyl-CoA carboxylase biotin carboxyl carrier protein